MGRLLGPPRMSPLMMLPIRPMGWPTTAKNAAPSSTVQIGRCRRHPSTTKVVTPPMIAP
jgi:hypothetical protein